jgi:lipid-A-disaccharide synthase
MQDAGMNLRYDLAASGIMGFIEVFKSLAMLRRLFHETIDYLDQTRPDVLVLIDYPGFNIRLARAAKRIGVPVVYYISPQVWAWKRGRLDILAQTVRKMLVILPFEKAIYEERGVDCTYVGHPLLDHLAEIPVAGVFKGDRPVVGLLPGSRQQEIQRLMPLMAQVAHGLRKDNPEARFVVPCVNAEREAQVRAVLGEASIETAVGQFYEVLAAARCCLVASGTATLETCLFNVPMAIVYRVQPLTFWLARRLIQVDHIGLVNILAQREIVPEFVQAQAAPENVLPVMRELLAESPRRQTMLEDLAGVREQLGGTGASERAARAILEVAAESTHTPG